MNCPSLIGGLLGFGAILFVQLWCAWRYGEPNIFGVFLVVARRSRWLRWLTWNIVGDDSRYLDRLETRMNEWRH